LALRILNPGGSGQVSRILARYFLARDDAVAVLAREPQAARWRTVEWDGYGGRLCAS
jgi:hypothetical protein